MEIEIRETTLAFFESIRDLLNEGNILIRPDEYKDDIAGGDHRYFSAYIGDKLVGVSAMVKYTTKNDGKTRIYHRAAWTHPEHRKQGVWLSLMKFKVKYIIDLNWCSDNMVHIVSVSTKDNRYRNAGWRFYIRNEQITNNGPILRDVWYLPWVELKEIYNIE